MKRILIPLAQAAPEEPQRSYVYGYYLSKITACGAVPVLVPTSVPNEMITALRQGCGGLLLLGGSDIDPQLYGATKHEKTVVGPPERDRVEAQLTLEFVEQRLPIFGVCRGAQMLNVALGGTLIQHVPDVSSEKHSFDGDGDYWHTIRGCMHDVTLTPKSLVAQIVGSTQISLCSAHHQAVDKLGEGLTVVGRSAGGIVEFIEHQEHPFCIATQSHPEVLDGPTDALWKAFVGAVAE
jgi:putative glutamine amidotransferase